MSPRSLRRAHARRIAREQRRALLRRRRELAAGVIGATALLAGPAGAASYQVTNTNDSGAGSLRDAITQANSNPGADTITFAPGATGLIRLTSGELGISANEDLTITGPGAAALTISGDANSSNSADAGDSRIFNITANSSAKVAISGLTLTRGYNPSGGNGGAIFSASGAQLSITGTTITNSKSNGTGGGMYATGDLTLASSTLSSNTAPRGGGLATGIGGPSNPLATITDSTISGNHATGSSPAIGGGIMAQGGSMDIERSTVSGNTADTAGGGLVAYNKYGLTVNASRFTGNSSDNGGAMLLSAPAPKYAAITLTDTTVSGNHATTHGAGLEVGGIRKGSRLTIARSTISGNDGGTNSWGGGILFESAIGGTAELVDSTVSGNTATAGAGVSLGSDGNTPVLGFYSGSPTGTIDFDNSTIAGNAASAHGGGIYLSQYDSGSPSAKVSPSAGLTSTIVADNTAGGAAQDLDRVDTSTAGGLAGAFSLVEAPGDALQSNDTTIVGVDPQLGALGDHGGVTQTMVPAGTSPVVDQGRSPAKLKVDQRNADRLVDSAIPNPPKGDGTDIGAVELAADQVVLPPPPPKATFDVSVGGKSISPGTPLLLARTLPLDCKVTVVTMTSCSIELRAKSSIRTGKKTKIPAGALLAEGTASAGAGTTQLSVKVKLTRDGTAALKAQPVGVDAAVAAEAATDATSALTEKGTVHLLAGPSVTLGLGAKRSKKLPKTVTKELDQLARLIIGAKTVTCTAYSDKGKGDVALTKSQAKAACTRLVKDGVKGKVTSTGKGYAKPVASNKTKKGRALNRRIVIKFTL